MIPALPAIDLDSIQDEGARRAIVALLNIVQQLLQENQALREENAALRDEIARLKGEQGRPKFPPTPPPAALGPDGGKPPLSSEDERRKKRNRRRQSRRVSMDREQALACDRSSLPSDVVSKGYQDTIIQDVCFRTDNVLYRREKFYSPSLGKTFVAPLPPGCDSGYGPGIRAWVLVLYHSTNTSEPRILELLHTVGVKISAGQLSEMVQAPAVLAQEKKEAFATMLECCPWQHTDDTSTRVNGVGWYCHVVTCPLGAFYSTHPSKSRLTVIKVLRDEQESHFRLNDLSVDYMRTLGMSESILDNLRHLVSPTSYEETSFLRMLSSQVPWLNKSSHSKVLDACALSDYHGQSQITVVQCLLTDGAPQFVGITKEHGLCWIHDGRLYKKLMPRVEQFRKELDEYLDGYWAFYDELNEYRKNPCPAHAAELVVKFETLVHQPADYEALGERQAATDAAQEGLLLALRHPELPLHNNPAELLARCRVRKRDVSFGPRTLQGAASWDTMQSVVSTLRMYAINIHDFIYDRLCGQGLFPPLSELFRQKASTLNLGESWRPPLPVT